MLDTTTAATAALEDPQAQIDVRTLLRSAIDNDRTLSQAQVAKQCDISSSAMSQWLNGTYGGDNDAVEAKVLRWLDRHQESRARAEAMPAAPDYVQTPIGERVTTALRYAQVAGDIALVYGGAGLGKTITLQQYQRSAPSVWIATMTPASAAVVPALEEVVEALGIEATGGAAKLHRAICKRLRNTGGLLIIDEAQHLSTQALDQLRSIYDATGVGLALCGNEQVYARMTGGNRAAYLDRLFSRIGKRVQLRRAGPKDIDALLDAWRVQCGKSRALLTDIATKPGALREVTKVLRLALMQATAAGRALALEDVRGAWRELGGVE